MCPNAIHTHIHTLIVLINMQMPINLFHTYCIISYNIFTLPYIRYRGVVPRWSRIEYSGSDEYGGAIHRTVDGFHARVVQHECDHLLGVLYPMRIKDFTKFGFTEVLFPEIAAAEEDDD